MAKRFNSNPLEHARLMRGLTIHDLAERIGRSYGIVWYTLRGRCQGPRTVHALCIELGVDPAKVWR